jgi:RNA polymerase sigma-70 factor (ECF subfamily)
MSRDSGAKDYPTNMSLLGKLNDPASAVRKSAWEQFRKFYAPIIAGFARNMGARPQDVDDVIQDVMLGFFCVSPSFVYDPAKGRFRGYLKVCTFRSLKRIAGKTAHFKTVPVQDVDPDSLELEEAWNQNWERQQLEIAMKLLKEEHPSSRKMRAFELHVTNGLPAEQVARELNLSVAAVYKSKQRVTEAIKEKIRLLDEGSGIDWKQK